MKQHIVILIMIFICSCSTNQNTIPIPIQPVSNIPVQAADKHLFENKEISPTFGNLLSHVHLTKSHVNPRLTEKADIFFQLSRTAKVTIHVYDPDNALIKTLINEQTRTAGKQSVSWDGKDMDNKIVPDEAYFFTITAQDESGTIEVYDPITFSGGMEYFIDQVNISMQNQTITYNMPENGRVLIRMGISGGPLLKTLVDWKPKLKGTITEYWNGKDKDNLMDLYHHPKFKMIIVYFTLPQNAIITYGNKTLDFRDYKNNLTKTRPLKPKRNVSIERTSNHFQLPRIIDYSPNVKLTFVEAKEKDGVTLLKGKTLVRFDLDEQDKKIFQNLQFEICVYIDGEFHIEDEAGSIPFNWEWDTSTVAEGDHLLTINISSYKDQIGVISKNIRVVK